MSFIDKIKSSFTASTKVESLTKEAIKPLFSTHPNLANKALKYIVNGSNEEVLLEAQRTQVPDAEENFGNINSSQWIQVYRINKKNSISARHQLYDLAQEGQLETQTVIRMAKFFSELLNNSLQKHTHKEFPNWLHLMMTDWLYKMELSNQANQGRSSVVSFCDISFNDKICLEENLSSGYWLHYILDRENFSSYGGTTRLLESIRSLDKYPEYIISHQNLITSEIFPKLCAMGKAQTLIEINEVKALSEFAEFIIDQSVNPSKTVRKEAMKLMVDLDPEKINSQLKNFLFDGTTNQRKEAATILGQYSGKKATEIIKQALEVETSQSVLSHLEVTLNTLSASSIDENPIEYNVPEYEPPNIENKVDDELIDIIYSNILKMQEKQKDFNPESRWQKDQKKSVMALSKSNAITAVKALNGETDRKVNWWTLNQFVDWNVVLKHPSVKLVNVCNLHASRRNSSDHQIRLNWGGPLRQWLNINHNAVTDLREIDDVAKYLKWPSDTIFKEILYQSWDASFLFEQLPEDGIWPYFLSHIEDMAAALKGKGVKDRWNGINIDRIIEVLSVFPELPNDVRGPLLNLALGEGKTYREKAQKLLMDIPDITGKVQASLKSTTQDNRINAAQWLGEIGDSAAIPALKEALKKESREAVRATLLSALENLGEDISDLLTPEILLKEAQKGLKKKMPKSLEWFPMDMIPSLAWKDNTVVPEEIPKWWVVLSAKLKDPGGNELILKYLELLNVESQNKLGLYVLNSFITQDTRSPSYEEAEQKARASAPQKHQMWQQWSTYDWGKHYGQKTLEDAVIEIRDEILGTYLGSAIKDKGILSLCTFINGNDVVTITRKYMKDHYTRRAQIESMIKALSPSNDSLVIQFLLSISRRYRTKSVQELARTIVEDIANRNGWTQEQLADRTLPTAGFNSDGKIELLFGSRTFTVLIDSQLKPVLINEDGKTIKSLPQPRQSDNEELVKESKAIFSASKKELKQVLSLTKSRLYEAMCAQRQWPSEDWQEYLLNHPLANRMIQNLIWEYHNGDERTYFRPTEDGALIDIHDEDFEIPKDGSIQLTHSSLMNKDQVNSWKSHLKDYGVKPLFDQLNRPMVTEIVSDETNKVETYRGYTSDAFTLRGIFTKLGYQRGQAEDAGFFYTYNKEFNSLGIKATIVFTGNCLPEENVTAALDYLCFSKIKKGDDWFNESDLMPLNSIPKILLSEAMTDLKICADKTGGYDPDWEKKMPW